MTAAVTLNLGYASRWRFRVARNITSRLLCGSASHLPSGAQQQGYIQLDGLVGADTLLANPHNNLERASAFLQGAGIHQGP